MHKLFIILSLLITNSLIGQNSKLAVQYYQSGEYEKAAATYKLLLEKNPHQNSFFDKYIDCLIASDDFKTAESEIKNRIKAKPKQVNLYVTYGNLYEKQFDDDNANKQYQKAIDNLPTDVGIINNLGYAFQRLTKFDQAIAVFKKGGKLLKNEDMFAYNLGGLYLRKGDISKMIYYYLNASPNNPNRLHQLKSNFQRNLKQESDYDTLKVQLYERINDFPDKVVYPELLEWVFVHQREYGKALRQARALDRRLEENGIRIFELGRIAGDDKDYDTAIKAYNFIITEKGHNSSYYIDAKRNLLQAKKKKVVENFNYTESDIDTLQMEYRSFLDEFGVNSRTAEFAKEYAEFLAIYKNDLDGAIEVLNEIVGLKSIDRKTIANSKIGLADYYLMQGEVWEATLLYSQVDKDFTEEYIGELARFKNAKLSYYNGDFEWAQAQFDILKAATSRLISNDAIDLSVLIMDNMNLDTTVAPLLMYAQADMLAFQNKIDDAFIKLDSIVSEFPEHTLQDDVLYTKAQLYTKLKEYDNAIESYNEVVEKYPEEIRADNSIFELAELYELRLKDEEKAKALYEKLFIDFSNSTYAIEARKRFRRLRGDNIQ